MSSRPLRLLALFGALALVVPGCSSSGGGDDDDDDVGGPDAGDPSDPDAAPGDFQTLITGDWTIAAGTEDYRCVYKTIEKDTYATAFRPVIPVGTHHTVLTVGPKNNEDGIYPCNAGTNYGAQVFGSGVGTNALHLPEGIAVKLTEGDQLLLNLHLFNFSEDSLSGTSGTEFVEIPESEVVDIAEAVMVSKFDLFIPPGESTQSGSCTVPADVTVLSVSPHMHMLGTHMKVVAESSVMGDVTLLDESYNFDEQIVKLLPEPVPLESGDRITIDCTYNNTTGQNVTFGDSSLEEMCISGHFWYPAQNNGIFCSGFGGF